MPFSSIEYKCTTIYTQTTLYYYMHDRDILTFLHLLLTLSINIVNPISIMNRAVPHY